MRVTTKAVAWSGGLAGLLVAVVCWAATVGPVSIAYPTVAKVLLESLAVPTGIAGTSGAAAVASSPLPVALRWTSPFAFELPEAARVIVLQVRLPRIALAAVVGVALAAAGTVMQGFFRNPMADPSIVGVSSGAAVGAVAAIAVPGLVPVGLELAAFAGALVTAFGVYAIATEGGRTPVATLLLAGVAVQMFLGAAVSYLLVHSGESLRTAVYWLMGNLHAATWGDVRFALPGVVIGVVVLLAYARDLNVLLLGEEEAHGVGIEVERTKRLLLAVSSLVTAVAVAVAGVVGFVGLIVPHALRLVVGPDNRVLLPASALAGASFLVIADTVARSGPAELPVGIVTAALGAPFFLWLLRRREVRAL